MKKVRNKSDNRERIDKWSNNRTRSITFEKACE